VYSVNFHQIPVWLGGDIPGKCHFYSSAGSPTPTETPAVPWTVKARVRVVPETRALQLVGRAKAGAQSARELQQSGDLQIQ
jgi:hypothetical protein